MKINHNDVIYDIGAGTGSCSVEFAQHAYSGKVYAFEQNLEAVKAIELNKKKFTLNNLYIIQGDGNVTIKDAETPTKVFIGGSSGKLHAMLDTIYSKNSTCRVVITAITLETLSEIMEYYKAKENYKLDIVNVSVARGKELGNYHLMMAQNPIYIATITSKEEK